MATGNRQRSQPGRTRPSPARSRHLNLQGQVMGTKGLATRRRLMNAMIELLPAVALRDLTVKAIADRAGLSPATFYLYFESARDCLHAAAGAVSQSSPAILDLFDGDWTGPAGARNALKLVIDHLELWEQNRALLRVRNIAAEENDPRFVRQRRLALAPSVSGLAAVVARHQASAAVPLEVAPLALASALFAMLDLVSSYIHIHDGKRPIVERNHIAATSYILAASLGCIENPA